MDTNQATANSPKNGEPGKEGPKTPSLIIGHKTFRTFNERLKGVITSPETKDALETFLKLGALEPIMQHIQSLDDRGILELYGSFKSEVGRKKLSPAEDQFERSLLLRMNRILADHDIRIEELSLEKEPGEKEDSRTDEMELFIAKRNLRSFENGIMLVTGYSIHEGEVQLPTRFQRWIQEMGR